MTPFTTSSLLLLILLSLTVQAQKISGTVVDATTSEVLPFVDVFFNNTSFHALTDTAGRFRFTQTPTVEQTLVVRVVGYKIYTQKVQVPPKEGIVLAIKLTPDQNQLAEVKVSTKKDNQWTRQLAVFQKQFLGEGIAIKFCKILNPWVLDFSEQNGTLTAQTKSVLEIDNQYLGYKINYSLDQFRYDGEAVAYAGYAEFTPYFTSDTLLKARWLANRRKDYWYSDTHFLKALKDHATQPQQYEAYTDKPGEDPTKRSPYFHQDQQKRLKVTPLDSLVSIEKLDAVYRLRVPSRLEIHHRNLDGESTLYKDKPVEVAWIETNGRPIRFNQEGIILNPQDCILSGYLVKRRVADMLPLDYQPDIPFRPLPKPASPVRNNWTERPFFTTDRPYYFSQDTIRLSGMVQYANPELADSMSSIIHVELVQPQSKKIVAHQRVRIRNGLFETQIAFSDSSRTPAHYLLRVYTNWMRNFGDSCYTYSWIPVLLPNQRLQSSSSPDSPFAGKFELTQTDSVLTLRQSSSFSGQVQWASLVMTDERFSPSINQSASYGADTKPMGLTQLSSFGIEKGINVTGRITKPRLKEAGNGTLLSPTQQLSFFTEVDKQGFFRFSNLPLEGRQLMLLSFTDAKGQILADAQVTLDSLTSPGWLPTSPKPISGNMITVDTTFSGWARDGIALKEVKVKAQKPPKPIPTLYKSADYTVQGKDLFDKAVGTNFLVALQGRVPGINIVEVMDESGFSKLVITMRGGSSAGGFTKKTLPQPLVLVDGIPFENINQLQNLPASQVERVEVVNRAENLLGMRGAVGVISIITKHAAGLAPSAGTLPNFIRKTISGIEFETAPSQSIVSHAWFPAIGEVTQLPLPTLKGRYKLVIEGLTHTGEPFRLSETIIR